MREIDNIIITLVSNCSFRACRLLSPSKLIMNSSGERRLSPSLSSVVFSDISSREWMSKF